MERTKFQKLRFPLLKKNEYLKNISLSHQINFLQINFKDFDDELSTKLKSDSNVVLVIQTDNEHGMAEQRRFFFELIIRGIKNPVIIRRDYKNLRLDEIQLYSSTDFGALLLDGFGDGVWLTIGEENLNRRKTAD